MTLEAGDRAPDFSLPSTQGALRLSELTTRKKVLVAFYVEDGTPLCSNEISLFKEDYDLLEQLGAEVVGISADDLQSHQRFADKLGGLPFPLAYDEALEAARAFGTLDDSGKRSRRAVFVVDKGGAILHAVPWFQPGNPSQYEEIFVALGFE